MAFDIRHDAYHLTVRRMDDPVNQVAGQIVYEEKGGALAVLLARNVLTVVVGGLALWGWHQERVADARP